MEMSFKGSKKKAAKPLPKTKPPDGKKHFSHPGARGSTGGVVVRLGNPSKQLNGGTKQESTMRAKVVHEQKCGGWGTWTQPTKNEWQPPKNPWKRTEIRVQKRDRETKEGS